jgi:hypothetical protein
MGNIFALAEISNPSTPSKPSAISGFIHSGDFVQFEGMRIMNSSKPKSGKVREVASRGAIPPSTGEHRGGHGISTGSGNHMVPPRTTQKKLTAAAAADRIYFSGANKIFGGHR